MTEASTGAMAAQTLLSLSIVLVLIGALAFWIKRSPFSARQGNAKMKVISVLPLSQRERVIVVECMDQWLVVGTTGVQMTLLTAMPKPEEDLIKANAAPDAQPAVALPPAFAKTLSQFLSSKPKTPPGGPHVG